MTLEHSISKMLYIISYCNNTHTNTATATLAAGLEI